VCECDHAWECWNCNARYWIDDQARLEIAVHHDIPCPIADRVLERYTAEDNETGAELIINRGNPKNNNVIGVKYVSISFCMIESND
jgi:hypothetical protein